MSEEKVQIDFVVAGQCEFLTNGGAGVELAATSQAQRGRQHKPTQCVEKFAPIACPLDRRIGPPDCQGKKNGGFAKAITAFILPGIHGGQLRVFPGLECPPAAARVAHLPFHHGHSAQSPPSAAIQPNLYLNHFHRLGAVREESRFCLQLSLPAFKDRIALTMAHAPVAVSERNDGG